MKEHKTWTLKQARFFITEKNTVINKIIMRGLARKCVNLRTSIMPWKQKGDSCYGELNCQYLFYHIICSTSDS